MIFPIMEVLCPQCKESMTLVNNPKLTELDDVSGYDLLVEYHYQCEVNERHKDKWHDSHGNIVDIPNQQT